MFEFYTHIEAMGNIPAIISTVRSFFFLSLAVLALTYDMTNRCVVRQKLKLRAHM